MPHYRVTIRFGAPRARYEVLDLEAEDLRAALTSAAERLPAEVSETAELAELRLQPDPDTREFTPEQASPA